MISVHTVGRDRVFLLVNPDCVEMNDLPSNLWQMIATKFVEACRFMSQCHPDHVTNIKQQHTVQTLCRALNTHTIATYGTVDEHLMARIHLWLGINKIYGREDKGVI